MLSLAPSATLTTLLYAAFLVFSILLPSHNTLSHSWFSFLTDKPWPSLFSGGFQNLRLHIEGFTTPLHSSPSNCALELYLSSIWPFGSFLLVSYQIKFQSLLFMSLRWTHRARAGIPALSWNALVAFSEWIDFIDHDDFSPLFCEKCWAGSKRDQNLLAPHRTLHKTLSSGSESVLTSVQYFCSS